MAPNVPFDLQYDLSRPNEYCQGRETSTACYFFSMPTDLSTYLPTYLPIYLLVNTPRANADWHTSPLYASKPLPHPPQRTAPQESYATITETR